MVVWRLTGGKADAEAYWRGEDLRVVGKMRSWREEREK